MAVEEPDHVALLCYVARRNKEFSGPFLGAVPVKKVGDAWRLAIPPGKGKRNYQWMEGMFDVQYVPANNGVFRLQKAGDVHDLSQPRGQVVIINPEGLNFLPLDAWYQRVQSLSCAELGATVYETVGAGPGTFHLAVALQGSDDFWAMRPLGKSAASFTASAQDQGGDGQTILDKVTQWCQQQTGKWKKYELLKGTAGARGGQERGDVADLTHGRQGEDDGAESSHEDDSNEETSEPSESFRGDDDDDDDDDSDESAKDKDAANKSAANKSAASKSADGAAGQAAGQAAGNPHACLATEPQVLTPDPCHHLSAGPAAAFGDADAGPSTSKAVSDAGRTDAERRLLRQSLAPKSHKRPAPAHASPSPASKRKVGATPTAVTSAKVTSATIASLAATPGLSTFEGSPALLNKTVEMYQQMLYDQKAAVEQSVAPLEAQLRAVQAEAEQAKAQAEQLQAELSVSQQAKAQAEGEAQRLQSQFSAAQEEAAQAKAAAERLQGELAKAEAQAQGMAGTAEVERLKSELAELRAKADQAARAIAYHNENTRKLHQQKAEKDARISELEGQLLMGEPSAAWAEAGRAKAQAEVEAQRAKASQISQPQLTKEQGAAAALIMILDPETGDKQAAIERLASAQPARGRFNCSNCKTLAVPLCCTVAAAGEDDVELCEDTALCTYCARLRQRDLSGLVITDYMLEREEDRRKLVYMLNETHVSVAPINFRLVSPSVTRFDVFGDGGRPVYRSELPTWREDVVTSVDVPATLPEWDAQYVKFNPLTKTKRCRLKQAVDNTLGLFGPLDDFMPPATVPAELAMVFVCTNLDAPDARGQTVHMDRLTAQNTAVAVLEDGDTRSPEGRLLAHWIFFMPDALAAAEKACRRLLGFDLKDGRLLTVDGMRKLQREVNKAVPGGIVLIEQRHLDRVYVPPGIPHAVYNVAPSVKVAADGVVAAHCPMYVEAVRQVLIPYLLGPTNAPDYGEVGCRVVQCLLNQANARTG